MVMPNYVKECPFCMHSAYPKGEIKPGFIEVNKKYECALGFDCPFPETYRMAKKGASFANLHVKLKQHITD